MILNNRLFTLYTVFSISLLTPTAHAAEVPPALAGTWLSILPPLLAILLALTVKRVIPALFLGVWLGAWLIGGLGLGSLWMGLLDTFEVYVRHAVADPDRASIILFTLMIGGMVGIISRNGGMQGIVNAIARWADSARHSMLATSFMGLTIFFDDYANTLVVGNTMRPVTDAMRVSREKLAYLVDSTAAPVACVALVTTWVGYEVGLIGTAMESVAGLDEPPYLVYLNTIAYSFYPLLAIAFVLMIAGSGRDFGPMLEAERRARRYGVQTDVHLQDPGTEDAAPIEPVGDKPHRAINALLPVAALVGSVVVSLYVTGRAAVDPDGATLRDIIGAADSYRSLMWASLIGMLTAAGLSLGQRILDLEGVLDAWYRGLRAMIYAMIILVLAWALGEVTNILGTADFLVSVLGDALPAFVLPTLVFVLAAATGFATGSSWGSMAILVPLVIPLTWAVMQGQGVADAAHMHIFYSTIASVLAGSVWGDHCSPISDTTILSSMASGCDHIEHVRTQLPYAGSVGVVSILAGSLPVALGMPWWLGLLLGAALLALLLRFVGRSSEPG